MSIITWIFLGALAGWLGSKIMGSGRNGCFANIALGIVGAMVGGFLVSIIGRQGVTGFNLYSILVATLGAVVLIWLVKKIRGN